MKNKDFRKGVNLCLFTVTTTLFMALLSCHEDLGEHGPNISYASLKTEFQKPGIISRPKVYWWWLNGHVDTVRMRTELMEIKKAGLGGVDIFDIGVRPIGNPNKMIPAGPGFMQEESVNAIGFALKEAGRLGLEVGLSLSSSWNAGGSWVTAQHAAKTIYYSKKRITAGEQNKTALPFPTITPDRHGNARIIDYAKNGKPVYHEEVSVIAVPSEMQDLSDTTSIVNVTQYFNPKNEILDWRPNTGKWDIYRFISSNSGEQLIVPSGNAKGPIIDHFDSTATQMHLEYFVDRLKPLVNDLGDSALKYLYLASYEAKEFAWTPSFPAAFKKVNGYDVHKFLPSLFVPKVFDSLLLHKFNHDYAETFSNMMIKNHYGKAKEICNRYGLKISSEAGGPGHMHHIPVETLKALGALDIPRGEFWYERPFLNKDSVDMVWLVKEIAAASHIYKKGIVEQEAFTSYWDWQEAPINLKPFADRAFAEGMNKLVIHGFTHNPSEYGVPGIAYFAGTHYNDKRVWWSKVKPFNDYLARVSSVLQNTDFVADVLWYYGEEIPNLVTPKNTPFAVGKGYDYEVINTEVLLNDLTVENGKLLLPGVSTYNVMYVSEEGLSPRTLKKLSELSKMGAIIVGEKPTSVLGLSNTTNLEIVDSLANDLWVKQNKEGGLQKGKIDSNHSPLDVLRLQGIPPDFDYVDNDVDQRIAPLDYIHYQKYDLDFYFIRNTTNKWISRNCTFRQRAKIPELWHPETGAILPIGIYYQTGKVTKIPLSLPPYGSYFVVFKDGVSDPTYNEIIPSKKSLPRFEYTTDGTIFLDSGPLELRMEEGSQKVTDLTQIVSLEGAWQLSFPENWGAPTKSVFDELISWTDAKEDGIRYFSGTATYRKSFDFNKMADGKKIYLDLGEVSEIAEVWLNDVPLGITWTNPHRFEVSDALRDGRNTIKVEVANTWSNRLTGDAITGEKYTETNIAKANKNVVSWGDLPLKKSGLLGPVTLQSHAVY
ncbi:glycosyl hydrolase [Spongiimicrobium sp. 3-5]|uniref:glycosyl hydrolase n=1 Tax=Spongiimicrobium sp. 3-5 TaxID=3332596 RepID=UPI003980505E